MEFNIIQGVPNDEIVLLPIEWVISEAVSDINSNFGRQNVIYILTREIIVYTPAGTQNIISDINGRNTIQIDPMTNALSLQFDVHKVTRGARLIWKSTAADGRLSIMFQKIIRKA